MNTQYEKTTKYNNRQKSRSAAKRRRRNHFLGGIFAVILILACSFRFGSFFSSAHGNTNEEPVDYKYYKSIEIQKGDSIWSIAERYMDDKYESVNEYIGELAAVNNLNAHSLNNIKEGDFLMVAYHDTRYK